MKKKISFLLSSFFMTAMVVAFSNNLNAGCTSEPNYNNGKEVTVQGTCQCDETSRKQECYQAPPTIEED